MEPDSVISDLFTKKRKALVKEKAKPRQKPFKKRFFISASHMTPIFRSGHTIHTALFNSIYPIPLSRQEARNLIDVDTDTEGLEIIKYENEE